ncbi:aminoacyl-tRNA deacylase [Glutamicibacter sp. TV12E]|uniref:aminoacyl-tRNA deacylase n=1 Tax=Glutamicibacter sp. TV12E TaxID=3446362 RepID=UPI004033E74A
MNKLQSDEALTRVTLDASRRNIPIELVPRDKVKSLEEAAEALGIKPAHLLKSLVIKKSDDTFVFALIPGGRKLDWAKLRSQLGVNKLSLPDSGVAWDVTHYESGTITPFGSHSVLPVYIDASVFEEPLPEHIGLGSGDRGHGLLVHPQDLVTGFDATIADISAPE